MLPAAMLTGTFAPKLVIGIGVIITLNDAVAVFPYGSVAVQVTSVVPIMNVDPDAGAQDTAAVVPYWSAAVGAL